MVVEVTFGKEHLYRRLTCTGGSRRNYFFVFSYDLENEDQIISCGTHGLRSIVEHELLRTYGTRAYNSNPCIAVFYGALCTVLYACVLHVSIETSTENGIS